MKTIIKLKWLMIVIWIVAAVGLFVAAPDMAELVREKGQITVPEDSSSSEAARLLREMEGSSDGSNAVSAALVFHRASGLSESDMQQIQQGIERLKQAEEHGIAAVMTHFDTEELRSQMVSPDGQTIVALVEVTVNDRTSGELRDALYDATANIPVDHYFTSEWIINEDVIQSSQDGLKRTELITLVFILAILFLVFRSVVAPFIPLVTVGFSYLVSQSIVAFLVQYADFPLSTFTQIFLVAVLFGIGTDYCILLISRFKEELAHSGNKVEAVLNTYRTAGKTVFYSGLAVLVGFTSIGFSTFVLYQSAVAVAVGIAVLLLALVTIVPFFMVLLGQKIFWPIKGSLEHKESRLWGAVGKFSLKRPLSALVLLAVIIVPLLLAYEGTTSYNSLDEIGDKYASVKAFDLISNSFGPGDTLPATIVVKAEHALDDTEGMAMIEKITRELANVEGVKSVRSATRPTGEALEDLQVGSQMNILSDGLGEGNEGLTQISQGLDEASQALSANAPQLSEAVDGVDQLIVGTIELKSGVEQLGEGLQQLQQGLLDGSVGAEQLWAGLQQTTKSADELNVASLQLLVGYEQMGQGLGELSQAYGVIAVNHAALTQGIGGLSEGLSGLGQQHPELQNDPYFIELQKTAQQLYHGAAELDTALTQLNAQLSGVVAGMEQANVGYAQAVDGQTMLVKGLEGLTRGLAELQKGIQQAAAGQSELNKHIPAISDGFDQLTVGQQQLRTGFADFNDQFSQLTDGLNASVDGLTQISDGLAEAQQYISGLSLAPDQQMTGWYIPSEALEDESFQQALDVYLSENRQLAKFEVIFASNPYEVEAMDRIEHLESATSRALMGTKYEGATFAVGGVSSMNQDLKLVSSEDFSRTVVFMLIGIFLILVFLFRSLVMPIYIILSLLVTYFTSLAITELIFVDIVGYSGLTWAVPFFSFVLLIALGVDYSIFLMDRFKENRHLPPREGILSAMKSMGTVIMSAAVILGGTFAAMLPSGVLSLLQIATIVLSGLFLYALIMLPLFIPVMVRTFGEANWWPFMGKSRKESQSQSLDA